MVGNNSDLMQPSGLVAFCVNKNLLNVKKLLTPRRWLVDPNNYEALNNEACSSDNEPIFLKHVVGDSDLTETTLENKVYKGRPKKGRKRKFENQNRTERKKKRNSNKQYNNYKGREIRPKEFINYVCNCTLKCAKNIPVEIRKLEFERFWSLGSYDCQVNFIAAGYSSFQKNDFMVETQKKENFQ